MDDSTFGKLVFDRSSRAWEGAVKPPFAEFEIGVLVEAGEHGPDERQREFYRELSDRYPELRNAIDDVLLEMLQNWDSSIGREAVWEHFTLESMTVPRWSHGDREWELCCTLVDDPHTFCVVFGGWSVEGVRVDG